MMLGVDKDKSTSVVGLSLRQDLSEAINGAISDFAMNGKKIDPAAMACHLHNYTVSEIEDSVIRVLAERAVEQHYNGADLFTLLRMKRREVAITQIVSFMKEPDMERIMNAVDKRLLLLQSAEILKAQRDYTQEIDIRKLLDLIFDHEGMLEEYLARK